MKFADVNIRVMRGSFRANDAPPKASAHWIRSPVRDVYRRNLNNGEARLTVHPLAGYRSDLPW